MADSVANPSILISIKKLLGIEEEYRHFDPDIIMFINGVFLTLNQLGIGPDEGFTISSDIETWSDLLGDRTDVENVKIYVYLKVRLIFDPPQIGYLVESINNQCKELEWRLAVHNDNLLVKEG